MCGIVFEFSFPDVVCIDDGADAEFASVTAAAFVTDDDDEFIFALVIVDVVTAPAVVVVAVVVAVAIAVAAFVVDGDDVDGVDIIVGGY